jgi:hypothetical protein
MSEDKPTVLRTLTNDGFVYKVPVNADESKVCIVGGDDWGELIGLGLDPRVTLDILGQPQAWCNKKRRYCPLIKLILDATDDDICEVIDGDKLNLVPKNIFKTPKDKVRYRDWLSGHQMASILVQYKYEEQI